MSRIEFINDCYTSDGLKLFMAHFDSGERDICVVFNHGMTGSITGSYFATVWADKLNENGVGFLAVNNRGHDIMNDMEKPDGTSVRLGTAYEKIEDCVIDFACGIEKARELGYKRIILSGHSLGCNKSIYYYSQKKPDIEGIIMASMPDMFAYEDSMGEGYRERLLKEARNNISEGNPSKLVEIEGVSWVPMSSETYVNWYSEGSALDNIPVVRNPEKWEQLAEIDVPILTFSGGDEEDIYHHMDLIKEKALKCPDFEYYTIPNTDHSYWKKELESAEIVTDWVVRKFK